VKKDIQPVNFPTPAFSKASLDPDEPVVITAKEDVRDIQLTG